MEFKIAAREDEHIFRIAVELINAGVTNRERHKKFLS